MKTTPLNEYDLYLFHNGTNYFAYEMLGAHFTEQDGKKGVRFAVWAKNAKSVSVVGEFNNWDTRVHRMSRLNDGETWYIFIEGLKEGMTYKYAIEPQWGGPHIMKADPYGFYAGFTILKAMVGKTASIWRLRKKRRPIQSQC